MPTIDDVRAFWDANPLWTGEAKAEVGSQAFFDSHTAAYIEMLGGEVSPAMIPVCRKDAAVLDLGCGIGFWTAYLGKRGFTNITGADLSANSLALAKRRCELSGITARFSLQNAEDMTFDDCSFDHVQCLGVIHHSPRPDLSIKEICRVLKPGGRAVISVYYRNAALRLWPYIKWMGRVLPALQGRGRENMLSAGSADEIVRLYDGADNPIGTAYSKAEFRALFGDQHVERFVYHTFPSRVLPIKLSGFALKTAEQTLPFMIAAVITKQPPTVA